MGIDLPGYSEIFNDINKLSFKELISAFGLIKIHEPVHYEWGYCLVSWLIGRAGLGFQSFLIFQAAVCAFSAFWFIDRHSSDVVLSFALIIAFGLFDYAFSTLRQALSLTILLFAIEPLRKRNVLLFVLVVVLAMLMHRTAVVFLLAFPLSFIPVNKKWVLVFCGVSACLMLVFPLLSGVLRTLLSLFSKDHFFQEMRFDFKEMFVGVVAVALFLIFFTDEKKLTETDKAFFWTFMLAIPIEAVACYLPLLTRISTLTFLPFASVAIPNLVRNNEDERKVKLISVLIYIAALLYYFVVTLKDLRLLRILPYRVFFLD